MLTIFNRKELLITMDMERQSQVRNILSANGIAHRTKVTNLQNAAVAGSGRARSGSLGINQKFAYEYKIYVHRNDYARALQLVK